MNFGISQWVKSDNYIGEYDSEKPLTLSVFDR